MDKIALEVANGMRNDVYDALKDRQTYEKVGCQLWLGDEELAPYSLGLLWLGDKELAPYSLGFRPRDYLTVIFYEERAVCWDLEEDLEIFYYNPNFIQKIIKMIMTCLKARQQQIAVHEGRLSQIQGKPAGRSFTSESGRL